MPDAATLMAPDKRASRESPSLASGRILLVMPAYNEAARLRLLVRRVREIFPSADVLVVDDGSSDGTAGEARAGGAFVARHPFNLGYGAALQTGYRFAVERQYDFLLQMDSDGQHDPLCLVDVLEPVRNEEADVAIGSRFLSTNAYKSPVARRVGSALFGSLASAITGKRVTDPTSGFWAMNREAIRLCARDSFPHDYPDADVLIALHRAGLRMEEVPVRMFPRADGPSMHGGLRPFYYVFKMSLSIFLELFRKRLQR
jgi:glycosyltransferase involved in cell wall biosynthesis